MDSGETVAITLAREVALQRQLFKMRVITLAVRYETCAVLAFNGANALLERSVALVDLNGFFPPRCVVVGRVLIVFTARQIQQH
jgi:hypothetical protein